MLHGPDGGRPSLVPGDPEKSPLVLAIRYSGPVKMPPTGKMPQPAIDALTQWVKMGAPWPGNEAVVAGPTARRKREPIGHFSRCVTPRSRR